MQYMKSLLTLEQIRQAISQLEATFDFAPFHNELFHSDKLGWIFSRYPQTIVDLLQLDPEKISTIEVRREHKNLDLSFDVIDEDANLKTYVIENKLQSIPHSKQLVNYQTKLNKHFGSGILLGPFQNAPAWVSEEASQWKYISYPELCKFLSTRVEDLLDVKRYLMLVEKMCLVLESISALIGEKLPTQSDLDKYLFRRFYPLIQKAKADQFVEKLLTNKSVLKSIRAIESTGKYKAEITQDFSHSKAKVNCYFKRVSKQADFDMIGIEIQDNSYNYCAIIDNATPQEVYEKEVKCGWIDPKQTEGKQYSNKKYNTTDFYAYTSKGSNKPFVYRRKKVTMEFSLLEKMIEADLKRLEGIIKS